MFGKLTSIIMLGFILAACQLDSAESGNLVPTRTSFPVEPIPASPIPQIEIPEPTSIPEPGNIQIAHSLTFQNSDGNRLIPGTGALPFRDPIDVALPGKAIWLLAAPVKEGITWFAALENGAVIPFQMTQNGEVTAVPGSIDTEAGQPPAAISNGEFATLLQVQDSEQSPFSHPIYLPLTGQRAYLTRSGVLKIVDTSGQLKGTLDIHAIPDARILRDENDRLLVLTDPTGRYSHGVLGDQVEAGGITLIETSPSLGIIQVINLPDNEVVEGIAPIWVDLNDDEKREIIVTISELELGARIVVLNESGGIITQGPAIGKSFRWRHQIAAANFGSGKEVEIAVVRTPHLGGIVEFYQLIDGELIITAEFPGITSHTLGSRNLDLAAAGDFDADGLSELLVLSPDLTEYIAVRRTSSGAEEAWRLPLDGIASSNLAAASLPEGSIAIAVGRMDHTIRIWLPQE